MNVTSKNRSNILDYMQFTIFYYENNKQIRFTRGSSYFTLFITFTSWLVELLLLLLSHLSSHAMCIYLHNDSILSFFYSSRKQRRLRRQHFKLFLNRYKGKYTHKVSKSYWTFEQKQLKMLSILFCISCHIYFFDDKVRKVEWPQKLDQSQAVFSS